MAERSKALRSGRSPVLRAWVRIPLLTWVLRHNGRQCGAWWSLWNDLRIGAVPSYTYKHFDQVAGPENSAGVA